ncbi:hypothetical protein [Micromonospora sp. RTP1Z1]|uniref:hypothetical protein n=1 Tax=Micromonospora sp. RTP1Z1 TaxID=2994043 RepID=UPI0029C965A8|nr:hypothetical protein [Micromonospora sp. RTP1Z1]
MMAGVATTCEECGGQRFQAAALDHPLGGRTIAVDSGKSVIVIEHLAACSAGNPGARGHR